MGHLCLKTVSKHLQKKASGHLKKNCGCLGCSTTLTLTVTGVTACTCVPWAFGSRRITGSINGTFTLAINTFSPCLWLATTTIALTNYSDGACGVIASTSAVRWSLRQNFDGTFDLRLSGLGFAAEPPNDAYGFRAANVVGTCAAGLSFTNEITVCGISSGAFGDFATGGTASI